MSICKFADMRWSMRFWIGFSCPDRRQSFENFGGSYSRQDRLNMTQLAAEFFRSSEVSDIEIDRPGQSYTYETIKT
jgi:nicotinic acid mononucleotide adenylyltransferase